MEKLKTFYSYNGRLENGDLIADKKIPKNAVYEVIKMVDAKPLFFEDHINRFMKSIKNMGFSMNIPHEEILKEIILLSRVNMNKNASVQLVYIPVENKDSFDFMVSFTPGIVMTALEKEKGVVVETITIERHKPNVKTIGDSYKDRIQTSAKNNETFELLLVNKEGYITEGSRSNVFFIKDSKIITSPAQNVLLGVTRKYILELCKKSNIEVAYTNIKEEDVALMEGAFLTGTTVDIAPIRMINDKMFQENNKIIALLKKEYEVLMKEYLANFEVN